jgi:hypothetical protein
MASQQQTSSSQSPRRTFSDRISAVGAKINRALSNDAGRASQHGYDPETESIANTVVEGGGEYQFQLSAAVVVVIRKER